MRSVGSKAITATLLNAVPRTVIVPDAETRSDLERIALGLLDAEEAGRAVVVRSAASFAAVRAGLSGRQLEPALPFSARRTLVVCGSHTAAASRQLEHFLKERKLMPHVLEADEILRGDRQGAVNLLVDNLLGELDRGRIAVLCTERMLKT
ncbi:MAG: hypothetical protein K0R75_1874, partial [Paenibacillaceae bacterium]|nr:hypothetical protein [Paenibacillaceae bacterium]